MLKILIADDHAIVRRGLRRILSEGFDVRFGEARDFHEVRELVQKQVWDILVLDISLPGRSGLDVLKELRKEGSKLPVLILSMHPEDQYGIRTIKAGASGYITKERVPEELVRAIREVLSGGKYISPRLAGKLTDSLGTDLSKLPHEILSDREYQVMGLIASGKTLTEIAKELSLSVKTISTYRTRILRKMRMETNADLIRYGIKSCMVT